MYEKLYDENEKTKIRFVGFATNDVRYDFGIVYTSMFFGKPLVICMQTGKSAVLSYEDIENIEYLQHLFSISGEEEVNNVSDFFKDMLPYSSLRPECEV